ncbi:MAG TPA: hypothetical protein EYP56_07965 [Planctomycetaceae bacterium]|nr:hypothetical protein [Planctomycetaceae bacterium]HIQ22672.1 hypothetical protein [Planctomycetota bacterium]
MKSRLALVLCSLAVLGGCSWGLQAMRSQSPDEKSNDQAPKVRLVGDLAVPYGLYPVAIEAVGLVTGLRGTGSDPRPSPYRAALLAEMRTRGVRDAQTVLASPDTALVIVRGVLPPGIQKGDPFDVQLRIPSQSETTSLRGGYLLETRLREMAVLSDNQVHSGRVLGVAEGPIMVDPSANEKNNPVLLGRGLILGGGRCLRSRNLALVLQPEHQSVFNSARIEAAVNKRFFLTDSGPRTGVAKAINDEYLELKLHPRYRYNIRRYVAVVRSIPVRENEKMRIERLARLEKQLLDPVTASRAALQLEAIGNRAVDVLKTGIRSSDPEVRFYAAEALAYLDISGAAEPLAEAARHEPAFRVFALTALSALGDYAAIAELRQLLHGTSAETRYGAFRALWSINPRDPFIMGEELGGQFSYHVLDTTGTPMVHCTASKRPEIVLFGQQQRLRCPFVLEAGNHILVTSTDDAHVAVSRFAVGEPDQRRIVNNQLDEVIRAIVELGGAYPDVVQALQRAKASGALESRFEIDALPKGGRVYRRQPVASQGEPRPPGGLRATSPLPDLFPKRGTRAPQQDRQAQDSGAPRASESASSTPKPGPLGGFFARMLGR